MQPERLSGFYKKEITRIAAIMAAFLFLENKSDKSQGLGQSPKVINWKLSMQFNSRMLLQNSVGNNSILDF